MKHYFYKAAVSVRPRRNVFAALVAETSDAPGQQARITGVQVRKMLTYYGKPDQGPPEQLVLTAEEELKLFRVGRRSKQFGSARDKLVRRYLPWAFKIAAKLKGPRLDFDEAVSAANAGLMEAIEGFDARRPGARFIVYSTMIIRRHVINALIATYPVKISDHLRKKFAERAKLSPEELEKILTVGEPRTLAELFERLTEVADFDVNLLFAKQEDAPFMPCESVSPSDSCECAAIPVELERAFYTELSALERDAIRSRFYTTPPESFEKIARRLGKSKTSVREAHDEALVKLRQCLTT